MSRSIPDSAITDNQLRLWFRQWASGRRNKNEIERTELNDPKSHAKRISRLWRERLYTETENEHPMRIEIARLRSLLEAHGIDPNEEE